MGDIDSEFFGAARTGLKNNSLSAQIEIAHRKETPLRGFWEGNGKMGGWAYAVSIRLPSLTTSLPFLMTYLMGLIPK